MTDDLAELDAPSCRGAQSYRQTQSRHRAQSYRQTQSRHSAQSRHRAAGRPSSPLSARLVACIALASLSLHCGTSARVVHEGTMHFEHCYRLDLESASSDGERLACWQTWSARHAARHPGDRAGYAERRRGEISAASLNTVESPR